MIERRRLSIKWIESDECDWPPMVKNLSVEIIRLRADLHSLNESMARPNMLSKEKIPLLNKVAECHRRLANSYKNLANELVVYQITLITQGNKQHAEAE